MITVVCHVNYVYRECILLPRNITLLVVCSSSILELQKGWFGSALMEYV